MLTSLVRADGLLVVPAATEGHQAGEQVEVELLRGLDEIRRTIVVIGSHDLVLDLAASRLRARDPRISLASSNVGSLGGLVAAAGRAVPPRRLAPARPGRPASYTLPYVDRLLGGRGRQRRPAGPPASRAFSSGRATPSTWPTSRTSPAGPSAT